MKRIRFLDYLMRKIFRYFLLLLGVSAAAFFLVSASPVDPLQTNVGQAAMGSMSEEQISKLRDYWGTDQPYLERYLNWAGDFLRGDMGESLLYRRPVSTVIAQKLSNSVWVMAAAWLISGLAGLALGIAAGVFRGGAVDKIITSYCMLMAGTPAFWLALVLIIMFSVWLGILPIGMSVPIGVEAARVTWQSRVLHAVLPVATLSLTGLSAIAVHTKEKMAQVMESDYVAFARARGESLWGIVRRHGLRNIALPAISLQFSAVSEIIGGSVLVEQAFSYPGLGQAAVTAGLGGDIPLLLGITVISATAVFMGNLLADMFCGLADPRIRRGRVYGER